jgi:hypothetical protein
MKRQFVLMIISIVSIVFISINALFIHRYHEAAENIEIKDAIINSLGISQSKLDYLQHCIFTICNYGGGILNNRTISDTLKTDQHLAQLFKDDSPVLVYRFEEAQCQSCVVYGMSQLDAFLIETPVNTAVFANYSNHGSFRMANKVINKKGNIPFYNVDSLGVLDNLRVPYFFILEKDLSVQDVFVPEKAFPDLTNQYFSAIKHKLSISHQ